MSDRRSSSFIPFIVLFVVILLPMLFLAGPSLADHTPDPASVAIAGDLQTELGCSGDWQPECAATELAYDGEDDVWQGSFAVPAGSWQYKAPLNDSWAENYGANAQLDGPNIALSLAAPTDVKFYYDHRSHWVTDNVNSMIATVAGSFQSELGCSGDWQPDCLRSWLQDTDGDGVYTFTTDQIPAGGYEFKVALNEMWDVSYPADNVPFTVPADGGLVTITWDSGTTDVTVAVDPPGGVTSVTIAGSLQDELGCPGDWQPDCAATHLGYDWDDDVWQGTFAMPAGSFEYKAALNDSWDENYGAGAQFDGPNIPLPLGATTEVKFYYDDKSHWVTDNVNSVIATAAGSFQDEIGCSGDWQPDCLRSWLQDIDGDGIYTFTTDQIPAGDYEFKVALDEDWAVSYPASNVPFSVPNDATVTFSYDAATNDVNVDVKTGGLEPGDEALVRPVLQHPFQDEVLYFTIPDRFEDGQTANNCGDYFGPCVENDTQENVLTHGFLPADRGYYHGGDIAGLQGKLDYLENMGVTAIWVGPIYLNRTVQPDSTNLYEHSAGYHGYWILDFLQTDSHLGANTEFKALVDDAHARGINVFMDVVTNHTADVVQLEGNAGYRNKTDFPYTDINRVPFDDSDFAYFGQADYTFPEVNTGSFPYTPVVPSGDENAKNPAWLNDPLLYHNRGDSSFQGENSLYGDFFGLDDLWTERKEVVDGMADIFTFWIEEFGVDGFRIDTTKHVNMEFWQKFGPDIQAAAEAQGIADFFAFGEVFDQNFGPPFLSEFSTRGKLQSTIDFSFQIAARDFASQSGPSDNLKTFFEADDYYTDADSNAYIMPTFVGNHDMGRIGYFLQRVDQQGADDGELLARSKLAQALMFFSRGQPVIYYGDEQGFTGDGGDKLARQDMFPSQVPEYNDDDLIGTDATTADDNFDPSHPIYQALADYAGVYQAHGALRRGAQIHRYSASGPGIYAFSRIMPLENIEYIVAFNNAESASQATVNTYYGPGVQFDMIYVEGTAATSLTTDSNGQLTLDVAPLGFVIYRAAAPLTSRELPPTINITNLVNDQIVELGITEMDGHDVVDRVEVAAALNEDVYAEVTFAVSINGGNYEPIGTDNNAPYRVFYPVYDLDEGSTLDFKAIVRDHSGNLNAAKVTGIVPVIKVLEPPTGDAAYAIIHYNRPLGDYGDHTTGNPLDYWGLHLWGDAIDPSEVTTWPNTKPFEGEDEFGRFAWIKRGGDGSQVNFIIHKGDDKDTPDDRFFDADVNPQVWINQGDATIYANQADAQGFVTVRYHREDGDYGTPSPDFNTFWGLHLWGDAIDPSEVTDWTSPKPFDGVDDYGAFWKILIVDSSQPVNFIIHRGDTKDPGPDESFIPAEIPTVWKRSGDLEIYPSRGAAEDFATIHYHRPDGDYGNISSPDFNDFWGLHVWTGALNPNPGWTDPVRWSELDVFGPVFEVELVEGTPELAYIIHRGDNKDPGPDQFLSFDPWGYEVWQLSGADPEKPYVLPIIGEGAAPGDITMQQAYWITEDTIAWAAGGDPSADYRLYYSPTGGMTLGAVDIEGGSFVDLNQGAPFPEGIDGFFHLANMPTLRISSDDLNLVPEILKGQIAVQVTKDGGRLDATGLQIPGVLDDLYTYNGELGVSWAGGAPTVRLWAPTAKSVSFHLFDDSDPATAGTNMPMTLDPISGVWSITGDATWKGQYYLYDVEVFVHSTGQVEHNMVTDPYSLSLAMNSTRTQIVDLNDATLKPAGWDETSKPELVAPEDITIYEIHIRDFSVNDPSVPEELKGTYKAFTLQDSYGMNHLQALEDAGLSHLHLLPAFDIATINENKAEWQQADWGELEMYPPDSDQQQAAVTAVEDLDGFNWGYDPFHYTTPEGSYSTNPDGSTRIVEFREMVQSLNEGTGLRVVMDVVYNHTNASGQDEKSVLDRIVPGYYHRLNDQGQVETSTCCQNTATEHNMMEKLMIDSLVTWAREYKVDAFRFDLMGHHMKYNMLNVRAALDALTLEKDGVDGKSIYIYGEGWNFGEVADNARGENATQLNMAGTGIGTFSDRLRDAVRGGGPFDGGDDLVRRQGFANGLYYDPNEKNSGEQAELDTLLLLSDQIRVGMAGNLADYQFEDRSGNMVTGKDVDYNGQPAGYTQDPQEDITYISKHDNQTLYDNNTYKIPLNVNTADRVRVQNVGLSTVMLGQGVPFFHAGSDLLRSKSFDHDSFNSGDWFNKLDFTYQDNNYGVGLPVAGKNQDNWYLMGPRLDDPALKPGAGDIEEMAALYQELLQIRLSSNLFRLETAAEIHERVAFHNTGPDQIPGLIVMTISDVVGPDLDPEREQIVVFINANDEAQNFTLAGLAGQYLALHPVQLASVDDVVKGSSYDMGSGAFVVPGRTTAVFVEFASPQERLDLLIDDVQELVDAGILNKGQGNSLTVKLEGAIKKLDDGKYRPAVNRLGAFINQVEDFVNGGVLTPEEGQNLIDKATSIIDQIEAEA